MRLIPFVKLTLDFADAPEVLTARLRERVEAPRPRVFWSTYQRQLEGFVDAPEFRVWEINGIGGAGRVPIVEGRIEPTASGSALRLLVRPHHAVTAFVALWLGLTLPAAAATIGGLASDSWRSWLAAPFIGYVLWVFPFWFKFDDAVRPFRELGTTRRPP